MNDRPKQNSKVSLSKAETPVSVGRSSASDISAFLRKAKSIKPSVGGMGRVVLAMDATMSRQPTWDMAVNIQADMFHSVPKTGSLSLQLVYFRGYGECRASKWVHDPASLANLMSKIDCRAGHTQIGKVLSHVDKEHSLQPVSAVVYIGDAMEENGDTLGQLAGKLGMRKVPIFIFQEGHDRLAEVTFKELARLTRGGWFRFDRQAPDVLAKLLASIAVYASGGLAALENRGNKEDRILIEKLSGR